MDSGACYHMLGGADVPRRRRKRLRQPVKLFTAKRIEKKYAFGTIPKIWEKPPLIAIGDPSVGELQLRREIRASTQRRQHAATMWRRRGETFLSRKKPFAS